MESSMKEKQLHIGGMTCANCQKKIENILKNTVGITSAKVSYIDGVAEVVYDNEKISLEDIRIMIQALDYTVLPDPEMHTSSTKKMIGLLLIIPSLYLFLQQFGKLNLFTPSQLAEASMGYGMLFVIGLLTSVHCVAMCGGINLSQCIPVNKTKVEENGLLSTLRPSLLYNLGRVISYTAVGFVVGGLGSVITFSNTIQGGLKLIAGFFMVIMGVNILGIFPWLRRFNPRFPAFLGHSIEKKKTGSKNPLFVGLLNGLMPCGPLQAMQLYALSTGSPIAGALSMFLFSLGTVPFMFCLGALSSALGKKFTGKFMTVGAVLVVVLGMSMFSQGWSLSGWSIPKVLPNSQGTGDSPESNITIEDGVQIVNSTLSSGSYPTITVQAGMPVKWVIDAPEGSINGCNNRIFIPEYNIEYQFKKGKNVIEFTPSKTGTFSFSCWMGMIRSTIHVVESGSELPTGDNSSEEGKLTEGQISSEPISANYSIPTDEIALAEQKGTYQQVTIRLTEDGFQPAVIIMQANVDTEWVIQQTSSEDSNLLIPFYSAQVPLDTAENTLTLYPMEDFEFSNGDSTFFGYVKVVEDISNIDLDVIKAEISNHKTLIWTSETFMAGGETASCH